ncbi:MAG: lipid A deacylase LpxR family protein [Desulfobulbaceae bacterium]|nr:lipid A deacylase LpxR family protein [Desulfobulbaceae bacterium]
MKKFAIAVLVVVSLIGGSFPARARDSLQRGTLSFVLENDLFYDLDRHYTSGVRLIWIPREAATPGWAAKLARLVPWFPEQGEIHHGYALGQSMFTPKDITLADPPLQERPYAGWLYGTIGLGVESGRRLDQFALNIGMVGPASQAEESQKFIHEIINSDEPQGWDTQLKNEFGAVVTYQRSWRQFATTTLIGYQLDFTPHLGGALGNVFTYANAGVTMRYGKQLPNDYGPPRIQPGLPGSADFSPLANFGWYIFAGIDGRAVARNIFLDGNTFRDSRSVDKETLVGDLQFGVVLDWPVIRFSYTHVFRSGEYTTQESNDNFGAISISVKL